MIHIGSKIKEVHMKSGMTKTSFAKKICCSRRNVYSIFSRSSIDTDMLQRISRVLDHNFFKYYITENENLHTPDTEIYSILTRQEKEVADLKKSIEPLMKKWREEK